MRIAAIIVATALAVVLGFFAAVWGLIAMGPDGTWLDVLGACALLLLGAGCVALAANGLKGAR